MTRTEFAGIVRLIAGGVGREFTAANLEAFFEVLGALPAEVVRDAAKAALQEHRFSTIPPVGAIYAHTEAYRTQCRHREEIAQQREQNQRDTARAMTPGQAQEFFANVRSRN